VANLNEAVFGRAGSSAGAVSAGALVAADVWDDEREHEAAKNAVSTIAVAERRGNLTAAEE
jgi:hypothetical protein